jgi:hypothetical protein
MSRHRTSKKQEISYEFDEISEEGGLTLWTGVSVPSEILADIVIDTTKRVLYAKSPLIILRVRDIAMGSLLNSILELFDGYMLGNTIIVAKSYHETYSEMFRVDSDQFVIYALFIDQAIEQEAGQPGSSGIQRFLSAVSRFYGFSLLRSCKYRLVIPTIYAEKLVSMNPIITFADLVDMSEIKLKLIEIPMASSSNQLMPPGLSASKSGKRFSDLVLEKPVEELIRRTIIAPISKNRHFLRSILLFGPPGSGKTTVAFAIARDLGLRVARINIESMLSKWYGETEKNLAAALDAFSRSGGGVLVIRNIEHIFSQKEDGMGREDSTMARAREVLINKIREGADNVIMFITSSSLLSIPDYLIRDPLFGEVKIPVPPHSRQESIAKILTGFLDEMSKGVGVSLQLDQSMNKAIERVSGTIIGYTVREIEAIAKHAIQNALAEDRTEVTASDLYKAVEIFTVDMITRTADLESMYKAARMLGSPTAIMNEIERLIQAVNAKKHRKTMI